VYNPVVACTLATLVLATNAIPSGGFVTAPVNQDTVYHYRQLAESQEIREELFPRWSKERTDISKWTMNDLVVTNVILRVPKTYSPSRTQYTYGLTMNFLGDSLTNQSDIRQSARYLSSAIYHLECIPAISRFLVNAEVETAHIQRTGNSYLLSLCSDDSDTLDYVTQWPSYYSVNRTFDFCFTSPDLLNDLELHLSDFHSLIANEFRTRVGLGCAKYLGRDLFISTTGNCCLDRAFVLTGNSLKGIQAYRLPLSFDWPSFPLHGHSVNVVRELIPESDHPDCTVCPPSDSASVIMRSLIKYGPRRIFVPVKCPKSKYSYVSIEADIRKPSEYKPFFHDHTVLKRILRDLPDGSF